MQRLLYLSCVPLLLQGQRHCSGRGGRGRGGGEHDRGLDLGQPGRHVTGAGGCCAAQRQWWQRTRGAVQRSGSGAN